MVLIAVHLSTLSLHDVADMRAHLRLRPRLRSTVSRLPRHRLLFTRPRLILLGFVATPTDDVVFISTVVVAAALALICFIALIT